MSTSHEEHSQRILSELTCPLHFSVSLDVIRFMWCSCSDPQLSIICGQVRSNKLGLAHSMIMFVALITGVRLGPGSSLQPERVPCIAGGAGAEQQSVVARSRSECFYQMCFSHEVVYSVPPPLGELGGGEQLT